MFNYINDYIEHKIPVIPVNGKIPLVKEWQQYSKKLPTLEESKIWEKSTNPTGYAIVLGTSSNICCIDIDCDDPEVMKILQHSPITKKGKKGETRFFRLRDLDDPNSTTPTGIHSFKMNGKVVAEFFFENKITVLPPSLHPDGMNYVWLSRLDLLSADPDAIPFFDMENFTAIKNYLNKSNPVNLPRIIAPQAADGYRFIDMASVASELIRKRVEPGTAISCLIEHDLTRNKLHPFFLDKSKGMMPELGIELNALKYYSDMQISFGKKNSQEGKEIEIPAIANAQNYIPDSEWGEIIPFESSNPKFPFEIIPDSWKDYILTNAENTGVNPASVFLESLVGLSSLLGNKVIIKPKKHDIYTQPANIWAMDIALPGTKKSQVSNIALAPLYKLSKKINEDAKVRSRKIKTQKKKAEEKIKELKIKIRGAEKEPGGQKEIDKMNLEMSQLIDIIETPEDEAYTPVINNATPEKLIQIAAANKTGGVIHHTDGGGLHDQFGKKGYELLKPFLLSAYDGNMPYKYQTKSNGDIHIDQLCLSVLMSIQPTVFQNYVTDVIENFDDGFTQRSLIYFDNPKKYEIKDIPFNPDTAIKINNQFEQAYNLDPGILVTLTEDAYNSYMQFLNEIEEIVIKEKINNLASFWGKYRGLVIRLAYLFEFINSESIPHKINLSSFQNAKKLLEFNTENILLAFTNKSISDAHKIISNIEANIITTGMTSYELIRLNIFRSAFANTKEVHKILRKLEKHNYLKLRKEGKSLVIIVNPKFT